MVQLKGHPEFPETVVRLRNAERKFGMSPSDGRREFNERLCQTLVIFHRQLLGP